MDRRRRRRKDHSRGRRRNGGKRESALTSAPMGWDGRAAFLCHEVDRVGIHLPRFLLPSVSFLFCARLEVFLAYLIVSPSISPRSLRASSLLLSILFHLQMEGKQRHAERARQLSKAFFTR